MCTNYHVGSTVHDLEADVQALFQFRLMFSKKYGNLQAQDVREDRDGPILRLKDDHATLEAARWGLPPINEKTKPIVNIRNLESYWWKHANREFLIEPEYRCLVPFTRFAEWDGEAKRLVWFELEHQQTGYFAGIWRPWRGIRLQPVEGKKRRVPLEGDLELYAFLTTEPNSIVAPHHKKAMPVIITDPDEVRAWMRGGESSLSLQRPYPSELMRRAS